MAHSIEFGALEGVVADFVDHQQPDLIARWSGHHAWWESRSRSGVDPYSKFTASRIATRCEAGARNGESYQGVNFASQDYLNLAAHPAVHQAAKDAIDSFGVHSAGSAALMGNTVLSRRLEERLADFLGYADCTVFPTGWGAGFGVIKALVRPHDHIVIDVLAHACLQEGARAATENVHTFPHLSNAAVERRLERIRREQPEAGILVVTETVFSMDSDVPDLAELREICTRHGANLLVDAAHDLGAMGPTGRGCLEACGMVGKPDILMGSFSKTFASNGGFVACQDPALKLALRYNCGPLTFTNALSPVQCAIVLQCIDIIESEEGAELRRRLMENTHLLRDGLEARGFSVMGQPSAIVPVVTGNSAISRLMTRHALQNGAIVNLVEYPAVSRNSCRWRLQVMAGHQLDEIDQMVEAAVAARDHARELAGALGLQIPGGIAAE